MSKKSDKNDPCIHLACDQLFNLTDCPLVIVNPEFIIVKSNAAFNIMISGNEEDIIGKNYHDVMRDKEIYPTKSPLYQIFDSANHVQYKSRIEQNNNSFDCIIRGVPFFENSNDIKGIIIIISKIAFSDRAAELWNEPEEILKNILPAGLFNEECQMTGKCCNDMNLVPLRYMIFLDKIGRVILKSTEIDGLLYDSIKTVFMSLGCDRCLLLYPCDLEHNCFMVPVAFADDEYQDMFERDRVIAMPARFAEDCHFVIEQEEPVSFGAGSLKALVDKLYDRFSVKSQVMVALKPKNGKPAILIIQQCAYQRSWLIEEMMLLKEICFRITDKLDSLLLLGAVQENEERYRVYFESVSDVIYLIDKNLTIMDVSPSVEKILGYKPHELIGKTINEVRLLTKEGMQTVISNIIQMLAGKEIPVVEYQFFAKDGSIKYGELKPAPLLQNGQIIGVIGVARDVTKRREVEKALSASEEKLRLLMNTLEDIVFLVDQEGTVVDHSRSITTKFNIGNQQILGRPARDIIPKEFNQFLYSPFKEQLLEKKKLHTIIRYKKEWYDLIIYSVILNDELAMIALHARDITEPIEIEQQVMTAIEDERIRIGQDLHDGLGQKLTALGFMTEVVKQKLLRESLPDIEMITEMKTLTAESIEQTKRIARGLVPLNLESSGFIVAVENLVEHTEKVFGISCKLRAKGNVDVNDKVIATSLFYITQEAINNAIKHGKAKRIQVDIAGNNENLSIRVENKGASHVLDTGKKSGMGLKIMQYRSHMIGAEFNSSEIDDGFWISVKLKKNSD